MDIFKNIQNTAQIRHVRGLQNTLFTVENVKLTVDKECVAGLGLPRMMRV